MNSEPVREVPADAHDIFAHLEPAARKAAENGKPTVVYILSQPERIGQVTSEMFFLRSLYPPEEWNVVVFAPAGNLRLKQVNPDVLGKVTSGMTVVPSTRPDLGSLGYEDLGIFDRGGIRYLLVSPRLLIREFIRRDADSPIRRHLRLTEEELARGRKLKERLGVDPDAPVVTLHVREPGYLPHLGYHSFRDAHIESYEPMVRVLLSRGFVVVRIGDRSMRKLELQHRNLIEAPWHPEYETFFEVYFIATSKFYVGTTSGPCCLAEAFDVPSVYVNCNVQTHLYTNRRDIYVYKKYFSHRAGRALSYEEIALSELASLYTADGFTNLGVSLMECTPREIGVACFEMDARLNGAYVPEASLERAVDRTNRLAHVARQQGVIPEPWYPFFAPALSGAKLSAEFMSLNPGYVLPLQ